MNPHTPVSQLNRVGTVLAARLKRLGIETVRDLIMYFPFRYEDFSEVVSIAKLEAGDQVTVKGTIELIANRRSPRKRTMLTEAMVNDGTEQIRVIWFGQPFIAKNLNVGDQVWLSGKVRDDMLGPQLVNPSYEKVRTAGSTHTARIVPLYSLTAGITQKQMRFLVEQALGQEDGRQNVAKRDESAEQSDQHVLIDDWIPQSILKQAGLVPLGQALRQIHFPDSFASLDRSTERLKFDELFVLQLRAEMIRQSIKRCEAEPLIFKEQEIKRLVSGLPFELTKDQKVAAWELLQDIQRTVPMNRMLEGDVGSGKTVVAAMALYNTALNRAQSVIMAPTEILARQHFNSLCGLLGGKVTIGLLTRADTELNHAAQEAVGEHTAKRAGSRASSQAQKDAMVRAIKRGQIDLVVGTHALLSEKISFKKLSLVIVDEQHRFGVEQRKTIRERSGGTNTMPHFLSMTATPIPRSFALTLYGDLDVSIIKEMPQGRKPVQTRLVDPHNREKAYEFVREQIRQGRQAFVICPLIEKTDEGRGPGDERKSVLTEYERLSTQVFPDLCVSFLHGKMKAAEKAAAMADFVAGSIDILVSTSVVEVGVDVPNASVMLIEGAERFGLAQLHQFRGRVGRSGHQSYCFVFSDSDSASVMERLHFFERTGDGFKLAEYDLERRGPGDVYGTAQSGMMSLRLATMKDVGLIKRARSMARDIDFEAYPSLEKKVSEWEQTVHLE